MQDVVEEEEDVISSDSDAEEEANEAGTLW